MALSTTESEYISIKDVAHALEIRSALAECGMTLKMMGKTDVTAGRAKAARRGVGRVRHLDARLSWLQQLCAEGVMESRFRPGEHNEEDLKSKMVDSTLLLKGTPLRPPMSWSPWMVAASFPAVAEAARDCRVSIWNVRNNARRMAGFWICVGMVIAILMVLSGGPSGMSISDDCSQHKETDNNVAWRRQMKRARTPCRILKIRTTTWNPGGTGVACGRKICKCCW